MAEVIDTKRNTPLPAGQYASTETVLLEAFGVAFQLWLADDLPSPWTSATPAEAGRDTVPVDPDLLSEFAAASADQAVEYLEPDLWLVMLKIQESIDLELIATGVIRSRDPDLLSRMATQCRQQMSWRRAAEIADRQRETKECDRQGAVEDLLFLQQTAGHLMLSEMSLDIVALAREVFPKLRRGCMPKRSYSCRPDETSPPASWDHRSCPPAAIDWKTGPARNWWNDSARRP